MTSLPTTSDSFHESVMPTESLAAGYGDRSLANEADGDLVAIVIELAYPQLGMAG